MRFKLSSVPVLTIFILLAGCAVERPVTRTPVPEEYVFFKPAAPEEPPVEKGPFREVIAKYRVRARDFERTGELPKALFCWKVVYRLAPNEKETSERIEVLERRIRIESDSHFARGVEFLRQNSIQAARKSFLTALVYNPEHRQSLDYLRNRLNDSVFILYESKEDKTLSGISQEVYQDPGKGFLIAYFNDLDGRNPVKAGTTLKLPALTPLWTAKSVLPAEPASKPKGSPNPQKASAQTQEQAEIHYMMGVRHFLAEELDKAVKAWEEALRLNPDHSRAAKDLEKARRLLENLGKIR
jgi:tetratricopeptide (TPR) repeat protein